MRTYTDATVLRSVFDYLMTPETQMSDADVDRFGDWTMSEYIEAADVPVDDYPF